MPSTDQQRRALCYLTKTYRASIYGAGEWDEPGIMAALTRVQNIDLGMVTMAAMRCAADSSIKTPAMIGDPTSSVYVERVGPERAKRNPSPAECCHTCGRTYTGACCDQPTQRPTPAVDYHAHADTARQLLRGDTP